MCLCLSSHSVLDFGQHLPNVGPFAPKSGKLIKFGETDILEEALKESGDVIAAFMIEPVQGLAGYVRSCRVTCHAAYLITY